MVFVKIGQLERRLDEIDESWINQQINRQRAEGTAICVRVRIDAPGAKMSLATSACGGVGGGRAPNAGERRIFDLWRKHRLDTDDYTGGNLVAFLGQLGRML